MGELKGPQTVHFYFPLQSFFLYITFKSGIVAAGQMYSYSVYKYTL